VKKPTRIGTTLAAIFCVLFFCGGVPAQKNSQQEILLQRAIQKETVDGDLAGAIKLYKEILANPGGNRAVAARALLHLGQCNEKLGNAEARKAYEQLVSEYGDQTEVVAEARARLAALSGTPGAPSESTMVTRRVWAGPEADSMGQVSPDGRFLSFTDWETGDLAIHDLATGQNRRLTDKGTWAASDEFAELSVPSPDSKHIVCNWYNSKGSYDLRIIGLDGSKPRVLRTAGDGVLDLYPLAWSPDGAHVFAEFAKSDGTRDMALVAVADGSTRLLKAIGKGDRSPGGTFSPDGRYLAWATKEGVSLLELQTGRENPLVPDLAQHNVLGWAPDGKHLLFSSDRSGSTDMWLIALADGKAPGDPELVKKGFTDSALGFTRTGAFYYAVANTARDVHIAELDPVSGRVVTPPQPVSSRWVGITRNPDWSPDGRFLAYVRSRTPNDSVIVIRSTSTGEERDLQVGETRIGLGLRWAPDGNAIVVPGFEPGKGWNLMRVDVQTGQATSLMPLPVAFGSFPRFDLSPDGRTIFYVKFLPVPNANQSQLLARDLQSARETEIIQKPGLNWVSVSPDGQRLVIGAQEDRSLVLRILPATGGEARELVRIDAEEANGRVWPSWTPDGRHVVFVKGQRGRPTRNVQVWRVAAEGGEPQRLGLTVDELWWLRVHPDGRRVAIGTWKTNTEIWVMENFLPPSKKAR
jgi:Tol biopolymer transport system component